MAMLQKAKSPSFCKPCVIAIALCIPVPAYAGMNCFPVEAAGSLVGALPALNAGEAAAIISDIFGTSEPDHRLAEGLLVVIRQKQVLFLQPSGGGLCLEWKPVPLSAYEAARRKVFGVGL